MYPFKAFYKRQTCVVMADTSYEAQLKAAAIFKARKTWDVAVLRTDTPVNTASL